MQKDFDGWNKEKKAINDRLEGAHYQEREIRWCLLGVNVGYEQDGTGTNRARPVLILRGFSREVCLVVPLTTARKKNPYHRHMGTIDGREAFAIISQLRLVDTRRFTSLIATLDRSTFERIRKAVKDML
jgi:mRNA-degrading endonuclease toxin of MazEF toxin-antitoxin module